MAFQAVSFVDGLRYRAESVRKLTYLASNGTTGVATPTSLKVVATSTPSSSVVIYAGSATIVGSTNLAESYVVSNDQAVNLAIPANNTSSAVSRNIIFSIRDPQQAGMPALSGPTDLAGDLQIVGPLPTDRPFILLASISLPANTGTITNAMIRDYRELAMPRSVTRTYVHIPSYINPIDTTYEQIAGAQPTFFCPAWATHSNVLVSVEGMEQVIAGYHRLMTCPTINGQRSDLTQEVAITKNGPVQRHGFTSIGSFTIPTDWRGTDVTVGLRGAILAGSANAFQIDMESTMAFQVEFYEKTI